MVLLYNSVEYMKQFSGRNISVEYRSLSPLIFSLAGEGADDPLDSFSQCAMMAW